MCIIRVRDNCAMGGLSVETVDFHCMAIKVQKPCFLSASVSVLGAFT